MITKTRVAGGLRCSGLMAGAHTSTTNPEEASRAAACHTAPHTLKDPGASTPASASAESHSRQPRHQLALFASRPAAWCETPDIETRALTATRGRASRSSVTRGGISPSVLPVGLARGGVGSGTAHLQSPAGTPPVSAGWQCLIATPHGTGAHATPSRPAAGIQTPGNITFGATA